MILYKPIAILIAGLATTVSAGVVRNLMGGGKSPSTGRIPGRNSCNAFELPGSPYCWFIDFPLEDETGEITGYVHGCGEATQVMIDDDLMVYSCVGDLTYFPENDPEVTPSSPSGEDWFVAHEENCDPFDDASQGWDELKQYCITSIPDKRVSIEEDLNAYGDNFHLTWPCPEGQGWGMDDALLTLSLTPGGRFLVNIVPRNGNKGGICHDL